MPLSTARAFSANVLHAVRGRVRFNSPGVVTPGTEIGCIPAASWVNQVDVQVHVVWNNATTQVVDIGSAGAVAGFAASAAVLPAALGFKPRLAMGALAGDALTADTPVLVKDSGTGAAATTGDMTAVVIYYPHGN